MAKAKVEMSWPGDWSVRSRRDEREESRRRKGRNLGLLQKETQRPQSSSLLPFNLIRFSLFLFKAKLIREHDGDQAKGERKQRLTVKGNEERERVIGKESKQGGSN